MFKLIKNGKLTEYKVTAYGFNNYSKNSINSMVQFETLKQLILGIYKVYKTFYNLAFLYYTSIN